MMEWDSAQSDCAGVSRNIALPRMDDDVKRRRTFVFGTLLTHELLPFATRNVQASCACQQEVRQKKKTTGQSTKELKQDRGQSLIPPACPTWYNKGSVMLI